MNAAVLSADCLSALKAEAFNLTNTYRALHQVGPLIEEQSLITSISQSWADYLARTFNLKHSFSSGPFKLGENVFVAKDTRPFQLNTVAECRSINWRF